MTGARGLRSAASFAALVAILWVLGAIGSGAGGALGSLTEGPRLAAIYNAILAAQFDRADTLLASACPPAPQEACQALTAVALWWQIQLNPESRLLDQRFNDVATASVDAATAWTRREPERAEAWFYLAGAYAPLVQWRVLRGERIAAAREGKRIKDALERALKLDPTLSDAHFGIGLYHYYADVAPAYAKVLRWLLFLPGGDRRVGLREMIEARDEGELLRGEADYQLQQVYLWYEGRTDEALRLLESLDARFPSNPLFRQRIAELLDTYLHDTTAAAAAWRQLIARAHEGRVYLPSVTEIRARLGLASLLISADQVDTALAELQIVIDANPIAPVGARARAETLMRTARARKKF